MPPTEIEQFIFSVFFQTFGKEVHIYSYQSISGGCINNGTKVTSSEGVYFLKWNEKKIENLFSIEAKGLKFLSESNPSLLSIPSVIGYGEVRGVAYLVLEFIESNLISVNFWEDLGKGLAILHQHTSDTFGLSYNNYIGSLVQKNDWHSNWIDFFIENRLEVQLGLAIYQKHISISFAKKFKYLYSQLPGILAEEPPSLLHGDLWNGNMMSDKNGKPCLIDPAIYYGNREIEIAFTHLFGGFDKRFYNSYQDTFPLSTGFIERADIYNLYPLLVHVNLFGESYLSGIERVIRKYSK